MIYLIYGTDTAKARAKARQLVDSLVAKKPDASVGRYTLENFQPAVLDELIGGQGLFVSRLIVELDTLFANEEYKELLLENIERLAKSENIFIILEGKLLKADLKKLEKQSEKIQEYAEGEKEKADWHRSSPFALADALGRRDKKTLWALYIKQREQGSVAEELHGLLFWQLKSILLASQTKSAEEAGLKPFVYSKSKQFAANYSPGELFSLSQNMISVYHDAHRGLGELNLLLERFILEI